MAEPAVSRSMDRRQRTLIVLGGAALVAGLLAVFATFQRANQAGPAFAPRPVVPGLTERLGDLGEIVIETADGGIHVRLQDGQWVLEERDGYPAHPGAVRATALGVADLQAVEPKTARAEWLGELGLVAPADGGTARHLILRDREGATLADLMIGNTGPANAGGQRDIYVRQADETQSWRARGFLNLSTDIADWLDKNLFDIEQMRVSSVTVRPFEGPAYTVQRPSPHGEEFTLADMPAGRELLFAGVADSVAYGVIGLDFDDVRPRGAVDFSDAAEVEMHTFDGLIVTVLLTEEGDAHWAAIDVAAATPEAEEEADAIAARVAGWAFRLPQYQADTLLTPRDELLRPV